MYSCGTLNWKLRKRHLSYWEADIDKVLLSAPTLDRHVTPIDSMTSERPAFGDIVARIGSKGYGQEWYRWKQGSRFIGFPNFFEDLKSNLKIFKQSEALLSLVKEPAEPILRQ